MALQVAQIVNLACQQASVPAYTLQAGQTLNLILQELAQDYNFSQGQGWLTGTFLVTAPPPTVNSANVVAGSGPYALPSDFLRMDKGDFFWQLGGINYFPTPLDMDEYDQLVQQPGFSSYPSAFAVDTSTTPAGLYIWPASSGAYSYFGRYHKLTSDITSPETSASVPWFPSQMYLLRRLAGEMMLLSGDSRAAEFLGDAPEHPEGAQAILRRYVMNEGNRSNRTTRVTLDQRHFGPSWQTAKPTKTVPW